MAPQDDIANGGTKLIRQWLLIQTLAGLAQWLDIFLIFSVPSFLWKSNPAEIALLASCFGLPSLIVGPIFGAFLDRANPCKTVMLGSLARTVLSVLIAFASWFPLFAVLVLLKGLANLLYWPSSSMVTNRVVPESERVKFFSSLSAFDQITKIGTPLVAGFLALVMDSQLTFLVSALATTICAAMLPRVTATIEFVAPTQKRSVNALLKDLASGLRSIGILPFNLLLSVALGIGMSLALAVYDPHLAAFLSSKGFDASAFSMVVSATGAGAVFGAALIRFAFKKTEPIALIRAGVSAFTVAIVGAALLVGLAPQLLAPSTLIALWFLNGLGYEVFVVGCSVNTQNLCPPALLGRMSTSVRSLQMTAVVLGPSVGAWLISTHSRAAPFVAAAVISVLLLAVAMAFGQSAPGFSPSPSGRGPG